MQKGMLFFYDWVEPFSNLEPQDFKELVLAMIDYCKDGTEPPVFTGMSNMVAMFVFPQLKRCKASVENGKKGGRPKKDESKDNFSNTYINNEGFSKNDPKNCEDSFEKIIAIKNSKKGKLPFGKHHNVYLKPEEYDDLKIRYFLDYEKRIDDLSVYLRDTLDKIPSHYDYIISLQKNKTPAKADAL